MRGFSPRAYGLALVGAVTFVACQQDLPTASDPDLIPVEVTTVEVRLPFSDFAEALRVFGGYGRASELGSGFVANAYEGSLNAATLARFGRYPVSAQVVDTTGTTQTDSSLTFLSGRLVVRMDTLSSVLGGPVEVTAHALTEPWDGGTATWAAAIDSVNGTTLWSEPGGGVVEPVGSAVWDPSAGDSIAIMIDSARVAAWGDSASRGRGVRLSTPDPGVRLQVRSAFLWIDARPSVNPDTLIQVLANRDDFTFIYDPVPAPTPDVAWVGGAPAWRSVLDLAIPEQLTGPPSLCAQVTCPIALTEDVLSFAALRLTTRPPPAGFAPSDTLSMDLRMVLAPDLLPKSPLGATASGIAGEILDPDLFGSEAGSVVEIPVTGLIRDMIRGETLAGDSVTSSLALLSLFEPLSLQFFAFEGVGSAAEPELRMILTFSDGIGG